MSKDIIVTVRGFSSEVKESKAGEYVTIAVNDRKKNAAGEWETVGKTYFNVSLEAGHGIKPNLLYKATGELKVSKYKDKDGETQVSFWVSNAQLEIDHSFKGGAPKYGERIESPADILEDFGATPF